MYEQLFNFFGKLYGVCRNAVEKGPVSQALVKTMNPPTTRFIVFAGLLLVILL